MPPTENHPSLWIKKLPKPIENQHKYDRGVAVIYGAPRMTGATRLAACACARIGAGMVKVVAPKGTGDIYRTSLPPHIVVADEKDAKDILKDDRVTSVLLGPGFQPGDVQTCLWQDALKRDHIRAVILDAAAIGDYVANSAKHSAKVIVTPHEGEFRSTFPMLVSVDKAERAQSAVGIVGGTMVLKGAHTVIAGANDQTIIQNRDVPWLATAGTGDVLAGMIAGLTAQGMELTWACAAAVWIHAECGALFGPGLVAEDLPYLIPQVLKGVFA